MARLMGIGKTTRTGEGQQGAAGPSVSDHGPNAPMPTSEQLADVLER